MPAAADVSTRVPVTFDPAASPAAPRSLAEAITQTGQVLSLLGLIETERGKGLYVVPPDRRPTRKGTTRQADSTLIRSRLRVRPRHLELAFEY